MSVQYINLKYIKYNKGNGYVCGHADALHAAPPASDMFTDIIVEGLINKIGCAGIISLVSRTVCDLNRSPNGTNDGGIKEYRSTIKEILQYLHIVDTHHNMLITPYLHLSFHGMKDTNHGPFAIEVGTGNGRSCSPEVRGWFEETLRKYCEEIYPEVNIVFDKKFKGNNSIIFHRHGDQYEYGGYGLNFHSFQIELSHTIRRKHLSGIIRLFTKIFTEFQSKYVTLDPF